MQKKKLIFGFIVLTMVMGCAKHKIPAQFQDDRVPKPVMYEKVEIQVVIYLILKYTINNNMQQEENLIECVCNCGCEHHCEESCTECMRCDDCDCQCGCECGPEEDQEQNN